MCVCVCVREKSKTGVLNWNMDRRNFGPVLRCVVFSWLFDFSSWKRFQFQPQEDDCEAAHPIAHLMYRKDGHLTMIF